MRAYCIIIGLSFSFVSNVVCAQQARYWITLTDLNGVPISSIEHDAEFLMSVYTQDLRNNPSGVFSAYVDVTYEAEFALPIGPINHEDVYFRGASGSTEQPGLLDEMGGVDGTIPLDGQPYKVFSLPFVALQQSGILTFQTGPATDQSSHPTLLYQTTNILDPSEISFESESLRVVPEPNSVFLLAIGLMLLAGLRSHRKKMGMNMF